MIYRFGCLWVRFIDPWPCSCWLLCWCSASGGLQRGDGPGWSLDAVGCHSGIYWETALDFVPSVSTTAMLAGVDAAFGG